MGRPLIGDSTLLAVDRYNGYTALLGFKYVFDAKSCRTLGIPSCGNRPLPSDAVEAIGKADGDFDDVVHGRLLRMVDLVPDELR